MAAGAVGALGGDLGFSGDGSGVIVNGTARVSSAPDVAVANGVVHLLDAVVLPPIDEEAVGGSVLSTVDLATGEATTVGPVGTEVGVLGVALTTDGSAIGLTDAGELITFDPADPSTITSTVPVTGVDEGSTLLAIDVAADGSVVAVSDTSAVYGIDPGTGVASPLGTIDPPFDDPGIGLDVRRRRRPSPGRGHRPSGHRRRWRRRPRGRRPAAPASSPWPATATPVTASTPPPGRSSSSTPTVRYGPSGRWASTSPTAPRSTSRPDGTAVMVIPG